LTEQVETKGLVRRPSTANIFFTYNPVKKISLQLNTRWIGKHTDIFYDYNLGPYGALNTVELNDYVLFDFIGSYEFKKHYSATVRVENILNSSYTETRGFTSRGSGVYVSLRAAF
ncbi:MAG: TonB-dependent receptor, partial [Chitinophagales bacterium]|nr:TonB-dependent receptor [Chitinophagales bacterium]